PDSLPVALPPTVNYVGQDLPENTTEVPLATPVAPARPMLPGYEILGELGRGGMGVVYKARHTALKRLVALKMILAGPHAGPGLFDRSRTEGQAVARFHHPHIVQIYEVHEHDGLPYCALELVEGGSLQHRLRQGPLSAAEAARLVEQLARAIHYA